MGMLPKAVMMEMKKRGKPKVSYKRIYETDMTKETALTEQATVPDPGDPIDIGNGNNNDGQSQDQQECANNPDDHLFSAESDDGNDDNDPEDDNDPDYKYSQSTDDD